MENSTNALSSFAKTVAEHAENVIKSTVGKCVLSDVPVVGYICSMLKLGLSFRDYRLVTRIEKFLNGIYPQFEKSTFLQKFKTPEDKKRLCTTLVNVLDAVEEEQKVDMLINLFQSFLINKISYSEFMRFSHIVTQCFYDDLVWLKDFSDTRFVQDNVELYGLTSTCLVEPCGEDLGLIENGVNVGGDSYRRTMLGNIFCDTAFTFNTLLPNK